MYGWMVFFVKIMESVAAVRVWIWVGVGVGGGGGVVEF